jgi:hypothetical protein
VDRLKPHTGSTPDLPAAPLRRGRPAAAKSPDPSPTACGLGGASVAASDAPPAAAGNPQNINT